MAANDEKHDGTDLVQVSNWNVCYNSGADVIALSCTVTTADSSATISAAGLILNDSNGMTLASSYVEFTGSSEVTLALNLPPGGLGVGDTVEGVVSGEVQGLHYFFEERLTISSCE